MSIFDSQKLGAPDKMEYMSEVDAALHRRGHPWAFTLTVATLLFFGAAFIWADMAMIDDVTRGNGQVIPSQGVQPIQSEQGGTITDILVRENDPVEIGQIVVQVSSTVVGSTLTDLLNRQAELTLSLRRLDAEDRGEPLEYSKEEAERHPDVVASQVRVYTTRKEQYESQMRALTFQIEASMREVKEARERMQTSEGTLAKLKEEEVIAKRGLGVSYTPMAYMDLRGQIVAEEGNLASIVQTIARAESGVRASQERQASVTAERRATIADEINKSRIELDSAEQQIKSTSEQVSRTGLRSPVRGTVKQVLLKKDGVAKPAQTILEILPTDGALEIEAKFSPVDRGFLFVNQPAMVKVTAYEFSIYGGLEATVSKISQDTILDKKNEPWFEVRLITKRNSIRYRGEELEILPGMTVTVDVLTDKKSVLSHILGPIHRAMQNAMTEH